MTFQQLIRRSRPKKEKKVTKPALQQCPQKKGYCIKLVIKTPKKPHSARRKTARVFFNSTKQRVYCYIPSIGHTLQKHSTVLVRGGRRRDIPGMKYTLIRGVFDFLPPARRRTARSKYGLSRFV